jgi:hypothetical protein
MPWKSCKIFHNNRMQRILAPATDLIEVTE